MAEFENAFKVKLVSRVDPRRRVVFDVTPDLAENQNVNYRTLDPIHAPSAFVVYQNTSAKLYNLSGVKLISRTVEEATQNLQRINTLRGWTKPFFGEGTAQLGSSNTGTNKANPQTNTLPANNLSKTGFVPGATAITDKKQFRHLLGAPPEVLLLSAYSKESDMTLIRNIFKVPVVIQQLSLPYPSDCDYIPTEDGVPFPTLMTIDLQLQEAHSPTEVKAFDIFKYRRGELKNF